MKLHLGCSGQYLEGFVNVDLPADAQSNVCNVGHADIYADMRKLKYDPQSIERIRIYHAFEHFIIGEACALLSNWSLWMKPGAILDIGVPDFETQVSSYLLGNKWKSLRHIFGSHEESWAKHCLGLSKPIMQDWFARYGLDLLKSESKEWHGIYSINCEFKRSDKIFTRGEYMQITDEFLKCYQVDDSAGENRMRTIWMKDFIKFLN